jgi:hypothetical protein
MHPKINRLWSEAQGVMRNFSSQCPVDPFGNAKALTVCRYLDVRPYILWNAGGDLWFCHGRISVPTTRV